MPTLSKLLNPAFSSDRLIAAGMSEHEAAAKGERFTQVAGSLIDNGCSTEAKAVAVFVPGRIEVLGKHTDYCGGRSLLCTVERGMCFVGVAKKEQAVCFHAIDLIDSVTMAFDRDLEPAKRHWSNYPMTVARRIARNFPDAKQGATIAMSSDLPAASGLSSSSAMIIGCFLILSGINQLSTDPRYQENIEKKEDLAGYLGCVENGQSFRDLTGDMGVGTFGGSQDHTAILCCKPQILSLYSFCPVEHGRDISFPDELQFVIAGSGVVAEKTGEALEKYNAVSARARQLVELWNESTHGQARCLRDAVHSSATAVIELTRLIESKTPAEPLLLARLKQFVAESDTIIPKAANAFETQDWNELGEFVNASQAGAERDLHNQVSQTIDLQRQLVQSGAIAASAFGAGFGGSVWGLYHVDVLHRQAERMLAKLRSAFVTRPGCGATAIY